MKPIWTGTISFGLVNIPIKLYNAVQEIKFSFDYLRKKDLCPINYKKVCGVTNEEVSFRDIVKGYEYEKSRYVILDEEDFKRASLKKTQTIEILEFIKEKEISFKLFEKPYYIEPTGEAVKAYVLLRETLKKTKKIGIAKFVMRTREYLVALIPEGDLLVLNQLRFMDEIRQPNELNIPSSVECSEKELEIASQLVEHLTMPFQPKKFHDTYTKELQNIIEKKIKGEALPAMKEEIPLPTPVPDIMKKLKESLAYAKKKYEP